MLYTTHKQNVTNCGWFARCAILDIVSQYWSHIIVSIENMFQFGGVTRARNEIKNFIVLHIDWSNMMTCLSAKRLCLEILLSSGVNLPPAVSDVVVVSVRGKGLRSLCCVCIVIGDE